MNKLLIVAIFSLLLVGCAHEAYYVDHEFGMAQNDAFDQQIAYKNGEYSGQTPTGMSGIHSEKIMDAFQASFDRDNPPTNNFSRGFIKLSDTNSNSSSSSDD